MSLSLPSNELQNISWKLIWAVKQLCNYIHDIQYRYRTWDGPNKNMRKVVLKTFLTRICTELHAILRQGNNLHPCLVLKGREGFIYSLANFKAHTNNQFQVWPAITTLISVDSFRLVNHFDHQINKFAEIGDHIHLDYAQYIDNCGAYLLVVWNNTLCVLYAEVFRLVHAIELYVPLFD
jgi:hypothetical protein